jgi:hypothetical protein
MKSQEIERAGTGITTMVEPYHIPLHSLTSKGAKNLLVPGRGLSGDQMAMSAYRVQATAPKPDLPRAKRHGNALKIGRTFQRYR